MIEADVVALLSKTLEENGQLRRELELERAKVLRWINKNNELWNAMRKLPGGLEVARSVSALTGGTT